MVGRASAVGLGAGLEGASEDVAVVVPGVVAVGEPVLENGVTPGASANELTVGVDGPVPWRLNPNCCRFAPCVWPMWDKRVAWSTT
jgi:hypothetical protein